MAIHDFGFRGYEGERTSTLGRILAIAGSDIRQAFKTRKFLIFYIFCISPAIMALVLVYIRFIVAEGQGDIPGLSRRFARALTLVDKVDFYVDFGRGGTTLLTIIFSAVIGSGIIARDREAGALEIYFTRGIRPMHYFTGKWLGVFFLMLCQVLFPFVVVWLFAVAVAHEDANYFATTWPFFPGLVIGQAFLCGTLAFLMAGLSSSTDSTRFALLRWAGALFVLQIAATALSRRLQEPSWNAVSPWRVTRRITFEIAGKEQVGFELWLAVVAWSCMVVATSLWLRRHLRPVEVVG